MPINGSGVFERLYSWTSQFIAGDTITRSDHDSHDNDLAAGINAALTRAIKFETRAEFVAADLSALPAGTIVPVGFMRWIKVTGATAYAKTGWEPMLFGDYADVAASRQGARGTGELWQTPLADYIEVSSGEDFTTTGGVKLKYQPEGEVYPQAIADVGDLTTIPATDERATLNKAKAIAVREGVPLNLRGFKYRCEGTFDLTGLTVLRGSGYQVYLPADATYDKFKQADGTTDVVGDNTVIALDISGTRLRFEGNGSFIGHFCDTFPSIERAQINANLACIGGKTAGAAEINVSGYLYIQGFAYPVYVPDLTTTGTTRQIARFIGGWIRSRFCLTTVGYFGAAANANDEWSVYWRTDRCGGFGSITHDSFRKSAISWEDFFGSGLVDISGDNHDAEASTVSIDSGTPTTVTLSAAHDYLAAGDTIVIQNGFTRASDSTVRPLVAIVTAVSGTTVTLDALTPVNRTASGLKWFYRPPQWRLDNCHLHGNHTYFENLWDCVRINDEAGLTIRNLKGGAAVLSGRQGALFNTLGMDPVFEATVQNEFFDSAGVDYLLNFGMIRETATSRNSGLRAEIKVFHHSGASHPVGTVQGIDPVLFFSSGRVSRFGSVIEQVDVQERYTDSTIRRWFDAAGAAVQAARQTGQYYRGNLWVTGGSQIGTPNKTVEDLTTGSATTIYSVGTGDNDLIVGRAYEITATAGNRTWIEKGAFVVEDATTINFAPSGTGGTRVTFSASGANLQAQLVTTPSPQDVTFSLLPVL